MSKQAKFIGGAVVELGGRVLKAGEVIGGPGDPLVTDDVVEEMLARSDFEPVGDEPKKKPRRGEE